MTYAVTVFVDIDGTILKHHGKGLSAQITEEPVLLDGVIEKFNEWGALDYKIILITGRKESSRKETERQLAKMGVVYDQLIMGLPRGKRVVINDSKGDGKDTAGSVTVLRNAGLGLVEING